jgi:hypothetical protein
MHYFIDYYRKKDPQIAELQVSDLRPSRLLLVDPAPIPAEELQRTFDWMKSWGFLETSACAADLVNAQVQQHGYDRLPNEPARAMN